jgi:hypothetical protein
MKTRTSYKRKSWKTSLFGIVCLVNVFICLFLVYLKTITITDTGQYLVISTPIILGIGKFFDKDSDVTGGTREV